MKLKEKIWRWWTRKPLPKKTPDFWDNLKKWEKFVERAPYWQVEEVYENGFGNGIAYSDRSLRPFRRRMWKIEWPKVSKLFLLVNRKKILRVSKNEAVYRAIKDKFDYNGPKYVIDENRQILGIAVSKSCVIDTVSNCPFGLWGARNEEDVFLSSVDVVHLFSCINEVNEMLMRFDMPQIKKKYWISGCYLFDASKAIQEKFFRDDFVREAHDHESGCFLSKA